MHEPKDDENIPRSSAYPSIAQIAGHALSNIFLDALAVDIERLQRINSTLALLSPEALARTPLRPIEALVIAPSQRLDDLAGKHPEKVKELAAQWDAWAERVRMLDWSVSSVLPPLGARPAPLTRSGMRDLRASPMSEPAGRAACGIPALP